MKLLKDCIDRAFLVIIFFLLTEFERKLTDVINAFSVHLKCCLSVKMHSLVCRSAVFLCVSLSS